MIQTTLEIRLKAVGLRLKLLGTCPKALGIRLRTLGGPLKWQESKGWALASQSRILARVA